MMLPLGNIVGSVSDNMPLLHFDSSAHKRARIGMAGGAARFRCVSVETRVSARATGAAQRSPERYGGSRCA